MEVDDLNELEIRFKRAEAARQHAHDKAWEAIERYYHEFPAASPTGAYWYLEWALKLFVYKYSPTVFPKPIRELIADYRWLKWRSQRARREFVLALHENWLTPEQIGQRVGEDFMDRREVLRILEKALEE